METGALSQTYVALDLETTGLDPDRDAIIEVGAVKFRADGVLESFETLVNPYRDLPEPIQRLTGIRPGNLDGAPSFGAVAGEFRDFVGALPVVGHNISFDLNFLARHGLALNSESYDTWDLASILLPNNNDYSLSNLSKALGAPDYRPHRALSDARASQVVFLILLEKIGQLDLAAVAYIHHLAARARWPLGRFFETPGSGPRSRGSTVGVVGLDMQALGARLGHADGAVRPTQRRSMVEGEEIEAFLAPGGVVARGFPGFEHRPQQVEMMGAVARAMDVGEHLIVEASTGVGKSMAYLVPLILYAMRNQTRVVVSTNTINLQEQLLQKDIPALAGLLEKEGLIPSGEFKAVALKGRANYLCLRRWNRLASSETLSADEARLLSKTLVWLQDTATGDRGEINLSGQDAVSWSRVSAGEDGRCPGTWGEGPCFLQTARDRAEKAHLVVVNHALLLSDLALGGGLLPEYQHLVIDEGHHLEEEATRQLGFQVSQHQLREQLEALGRLAAEARAALRVSSPSTVQLRRGEELLAELDDRWRVAFANAWDRLWGEAEKFLYLHQDEGGDQLQLRVTRSTRAQPGWSGLEIAWENVDVGLTEGIGLLDRLRHLLEGISSEGPAGPNALALDLSTWQETVLKVQARLKVLFGAAADDQRVDWMALVQDRIGGSSGPSYAALHSAPLNVAAELDGRLFSRKSSVILTSATLSTQGSFDYIRDRVGLAESSGLQVGSPFDYSRAALLLIPEDIPLPDSWGYQEALQQVLLGLGKVLGGRTLVLFTSHGALRGAAETLRHPLEAEGIQLLAQGVDGSPRRILQRFATDPKGVILGTSSFWEGVDLAGGLLKALVVARLPFHVPTEPIFAARSTQYEDAFRQYALPQAVLRFRQGTGRLIRGSGDRGAIVVLDGRIVAKPYGRAFLDSIPPCTIKRVTLSSIPGYAAGWVKGVD